MNATVFVSDPWDFGTQCGMGPFSVKVLGRKHGRLLIRLRQAIVYGSEAYEAVMTSCRHARDSHADIAANEQVAANLLFLPAADTDVLEGRYPARGFVATGSVSTDRPWMPKAIDDEHRQKLIDRTPLS